MTKALRIRGIRLYFFLAMTVLTLFSSTDTSVLPLKLTMVRGMGAPDPIR